ncbi:hypothetical protein CU098_013345 [Rhizopus stolonifer]|uniref:Uncharacterized protein n=1 Tax=Rhizopus stolonifer TaxID=4846 RepID=A0A367KVL5_RHIST|nr:hypothetical protein CU098_013345 [Rhizopus stolonifer]
MSKRAKLTHDPQVHSRHLKRQLESLEKDNHESLNDVEGLISMALEAQEQEGISTRKPRGSRNTNIYSTRTNLNALLEESYSQPLDIKLVLLLPRYTHQESFAQFVDTLAIINA